MLGQFCTGITIITTVHDDVPIGFACQSFAALSLDPPLVLFCPTKVSRSWKAIEATQQFCVNVLTEKQKDVSARFGSRSTNMLIACTRGAPGRSSTIPPTARAVPPTSSAAMNARRGIE